MPPKQPSEPPPQPPPELPRIGFPPPLAPLTGQGDARPRCFYCFKEIYTDYPGWGFSDDNGILRWWHSECFQQTEGIKVS